MVRLAGYGARYPAQLSGGEQQRVALARALVFHPPVLLMDEPLGALDRKLRQRMQIEIKMLHREIGTTIIFVTHDQEEALSMADRVAVLQHGRLQQIGSPRELYDDPTNVFVADFIGETNLIDVEIVESRNGRLTARLADGPAVLSLPSCERPVGSRHRLAVRPEPVDLVDHGSGIDATVVETVYGSASISLLLAIGTRHVTARVPVPRTGCIWSVGDKVALAFDAERCRVYDP